MADSAHGIREDGGYFQGLQIKWYLSWKYHIVPVDRLWPNELDMTKIVQLQVVLFVWFPPPMPVAGIVMRV